jgi:hypothetical protein
VPDGADEPLAASYLTLRRGTDVFDRFDVHVGRVKRALTEAGDFFDGLIIETDAGARFVDAPEVARITPRRVELSIARSDLECPGPRGVYGVTPARWGRKDATVDDGSKSSTRRRPRTAPTWTNAAIAAPYAVTRPMTSSIC